MPKLHVEVNQQMDFKVDIYDTPVGNQFFNQHLAATARDPVRAVPVITDFTKYTINYFLKLVQQALDTNTLNWANYNIVPGIENYHSNQVQFNSMHKDLEITAGMNRYAGLDQDQINLVDELHCCLHSLETEQAPLDYTFRPRTIVNFSYFIDNATNNHMPEPTKFSRTMQPGEIQLDYPYVGKEPFFCMMHSDNSILQQTCKMIDRISLNWKLNASGVDQTEWGPKPWPDDVDAELTKWYYEYQTEMEALGYSLQKILDHTGFCIPGRVEDHSKLVYLRDTPNIQVTGYQLIN